jgi:hypothetical protein
MEKLSRSDDAYLEFFKTEHDLVKKEKFAQLELNKQDDIERELFSSLQIALRESQEKEKMRVERTKYWSIIGSVIGALAGMIGKFLFFFFFSRFVFFKVQQYPIVIVCKNFVRSQVNPKNFMKI